MSRSTWRTHHHGCCHSLEGRRAARRHLQPSRTQQPMSFARGAPGCNDCPKHHLKVGFSCQYVRFNTTGESHVRLCHLHSSRRQGLLAALQAAAWSVIHLLPQSTVTPPIDFLIVSLQVGKDKKKKKRQTQTFRRSRHCQGGERKRNLTVIRVHVECAKVQG
jgi:hypothetical protein